MFIHEPAQFSLAGQLPDCLHSNLSGLGRIGGKIAQIQAFFSWFYAFAKVACGVAGNRPAGTQPLSTGENAMYTVNHNFDAGLITGEARLIVVRK
ncbi:MAG: hypothetical protein JAY69_07085 [Candidatus Thiodiazotropha taylori]|nr:hypothetical protein [Candidatus Thiodiazotropha taylori]MCW4232375.1 hypothetical protein [Candidatus Thiodiazotropha taylori]